MTLMLKVKRLTETAKLPTYAHDGDACFDLYADNVTELSVITSYSIHYTKLYDLCKASSGCRS